MSRPGSTATVGDQITARLTEFLLTTAARELVSRFVQAEQQAALPLLLEVPELEAQERHQRRITRLPFTAGVTVTLSVDLPEGLIACKVSQVQNGFLGCAPEEGIRRQQPARWINLRFIKEITPRER